MHPITTPGAPAQPKQTAPTPDHGIGYTNHPSKQPAHPIKLSGARTHPNHTAAAPKPMIGSTHQAGERRAHPIELSGALAGPSRRRAHLITVLGASARPESVVTAPDGGSGAATSDQGRVEVREEPEAAVKGRCGTNQDGMRLKRAKRQDPLRDQTKSGAGRRRCCATRTVLCDAARRGAQLKRGRRDGTARTAQHERHSTNGTTRTAQHERHNTNG
ncbi:hypothetical protein Acsp01_04360 [Actinoplanes sp. NBRC 101535]|nr:hypothetical protein Acsp01_04360 [Actinoplanes sp. NBRC 101535]